jgi:hypothetical protein
MANQMILMIFPRHNYKVARLRRDTRVIAAWLPTQVIKRFKRNVHNASEMTTMTALSTRQATNEAKTVNLIRCIPITRHTLGVDAGTYKLYWLSTKTRTININDRTTIRKNRR